MSDPVLQAKESPWLTVIGLGEDGLAGLSEASRKALQQAKTIFGGPRHLELVAAGTKGHAWPVPFSTAPVLALRGQPVVVLASGDPFWFGAGGALARDLAAQGIAPSEWVSQPAPSGFS
jgi:precorrin-6Y C5,15-methyltransferase (decarboxylating)